MSPVPATAAPVRLRVEHLDDAALGLGTEAPRLSWQLPAGTTAQLRYRLALDDRPLAWVDSSDNVLVPWPAAPVGSLTRVGWRVQVETDAGESAWSPEAWFETGLLAVVDWSARWIEPEDPAPAVEGGRPPHLLRHRFTLTDVSGPARLHATAHGVYETFLNGRRVGDHELAPGFTSYWDHLDVQTHDVGGLLVPGENVWTVVLSDGWYRGGVGIDQVRDAYGDSVAFLAQLHVGPAVVAATGPGWEATTGPILAADLMDGQVEDRRVGPGPWRPVPVVDHDLTRLTASPAPPTRRIEELRPVAVRRLDERRQVVDLGQNINGWVRLDDLGPAGTDLTLVHGEALDAEGDVTLEHLWSGDRRVRQTDRVISAGEPGDRFEPRHTVHGFQYVRVEGHPDRLSVDDVTGVVVHTDLRRTGWFRCSDDRINRLHEIADWSFRDNACEIPTDCPQRERSGWTGDWQAFQPSAAFLYDVAGFSTKWLRSLAADQLPDGCLTNLAPEARRARRSPDDPTWTGMFGSSGWGDAVVLVPWQLHAAYGDAQVLADVWPAMVRWVDYAARAARDRRHPRRAAERPEPLPHEEHLWDGGWHWGEWLEPGTPAEPFWEADQGHVATAYLHRSAALLARIGRQLGHDRDAERYDVLAERARDAWRAEYLAEDGSLGPDTQATHVRALAFDLVPAQLRARTAQRLVELVAEAGGHLSTGFLATPDLLPVLADAGYLEVAYDLLFQDAPPSWLTMVDRGASTVWESWEGIDEHGVAHESLNHYSKGAVISFLHTHVSGIRVLEDHPGYRHFRIAPMPDPRLEWAEAVHDSPHGRIESSWTSRNGHFELVVSVPPGTTAEVILPDGRSTTQGPGTATYACAAPAGG